eukprot:symbB.v1.2.015351.t1/scaffold1140.1/size135646/2
MDVTVSIHDWKSLSQSEIIVRHLYAILQPGHLDSHAGHQSNRVAVNQGSITAQSVVRFCEIGPDNGHLSGHNFQYFLTYLAQGLGRVGKEYLKSSAVFVLNMREMQLFSNLLPEFGSLPWALKPLLVLVIERGCSAKSQQRLLAAAAIITAATWLLLSWHSTSGSALLLATALVSLGSAVVDGLTDGMISAESTEATAAKLQSLCQTGHSIGALCVGIAAWALTMPDWLALTCTAFAWAVIAPVVMRTPVPVEKATSKKQMTSLPNLFLQRDAALVTILGFAVCLAPPADVFLYRQHVLGLEGFQQPIISIAGTIGWFSCTLIYRKKISAGRTATNTLRLCLKLWLVPLLAKALILSPTKVLVLPAALLENAANEFGKALTFLPVTVLQQLHTPAGCEGSAFTLMQAGGTLGTVIGRNFEWQLLRWCRVDMSLGAAGFSNFSAVLVVAGVWRATTALVLCLVLLPRLDAHSASEKGLAMIGQTVRKGNGLSMYNAEFRSGSAEIPLILSIKNSQTETTMYVRNIPMSAVLDRGGLQQRWVGVYPPGDPLNLHFDPTQPPRDGSPQVCLSVAVHEDLLATVANVPVADPFASAASSGAFGSWRFSPEHRLSELPSSDKVDQLRRSITSLQAEMKLSQDRGDGERGVAFGRESLLPVAGGSHHGSRNSHSELMPGSDLAPWPSISGAAKTGKVELDSWLKEKERQAQKIKEHVEDMAKAQRRAEDVGRDLQEQLDLLAELRRRSRSAEAKGTPSSVDRAMGAANCSSGCVAAEKDTQLVFDLQSQSAPVFEPAFDPLNLLSEDLFDDKVMAERLPSAVVQNFKECLITGSPTAEEDH